MARIFISYRREDGIAQSGRIYDRLVAHMGDADVFMDLGKISAGVDFAKVLEEQLGSCEVFIAVIGPRWLISRKGRRRLDDPEDFVRLEIATALKRGIRVLPVLLGDARMPGPDELPPDMAEFARRNAVRMRDERFDADMDSLILDIEEPDRRPEDTLLGRVQRMREEIRKRRNTVLAGLAVVLAAVIANWTDVFDLLALDTRLETLVMAIGDGYRDAPPSDQVVVVGIDIGTENAMGTTFSRLWRRHHAELVERLRAARVRAIAFDMYFEESTEFDTALVASLARARASGVETYVGTRHKGDPDPKMFAGLRQAVTGAGSLCIGRRMGYATTATLMVSARQETEAQQGKRFGLGLLAALGDSPATSLDNNARTLLVPVRTQVREIDVGAIERIKTPQNNCPLLEVGDVSANLFIGLSPATYWRSAPRYVRYEDIVQGPGDFGSSTLAGTLSGKTILVGLTGTTSSSDLHAVVRGFSSELRYGVELHADVVSNLLESRQIHALHWGGQLVLTMLTVAMATLVRLATNGRSRAIRWGAIVLAVLMYVWFAGYLCARHQLLLNCVYHLFGFGVAYWLTGKIHLTGKRT